jgi:hypothetical protein
MTEKKLSTDAASTNFFWNHNGFNLQTTFRGIVSAEQAEEHLNSITRALGSVNELQGKPRARNGNGEQQAELPTENVSHPTSELYFEAVELVGEMKSGKPYWKVKGGKYTRFGVTIWPEVLEAAEIKPDKLDVAKTYKLDGFTAYYELNEETGNPQKVVNLAKA